MADSYNYENIAKAAGLNHKPYCKGFMDNFDYDADGNPIPREYPRMYVYDNDPPEIVTDSHGNTRIRVRVECCDCGASGVVDILDDPSLRNIPSAVQQTDIKEYSISTNVMGGSDVTEKYVDPDQTEPETE